MPSRLHLLAPTLALIGLAGALPAATSPGERDAQFEAVRSLIDRDLRLPAQRQLADFQKAGHPEAEAWGKFLSWAYADRFRTVSPDKAEQAKLDAEAKALGAELEALAKAGKLPKELADQVSGSGKVIRLVNDLSRVLGQDQAPDRLGAAAVPAERRTVLNATVKALVEMAAAAMADGVAKVEANKAAEEETWGLEATDPKYLKVAQEAVERRLAAVRTVYFAVKVLREVAERGDQHGVDQAPAKAFLREFATKNAEKLQEWDYSWGDYHPYLRALSLDLAAQGARFKLKNLSPDDMIGDLLKVTEIDAGKEYKIAAVADDVRTLQAKTWGSLFQLYRELGADLDQKWWQQGADTYRAFREKYKNDRHFRVDHPDRERAVEMARLHIQAGRLLAAKGDPNAAAAFGMVAAVRTNPLAGNAAAWSMFYQSSNVASTASAWSAQPVAEDPSAALLTAAALMRASRSSPDPKVQRESLLGAAASLRNATLGLTSAAYAETSDESAPEVWFRYAQALNQLGMRWHAALVAQAGLRHLQSRVTELKRNPWRDAKTSKWNQQGRFVSPLAKNAVNYASQLLTAGRGPSITSLYDDTISLVNKVSPEDGGKALDRIQIVFRIMDKDFTGAMAAIEAYVKKFPEEFYDGASLRSSVSIASYDAAKSEAEKKQIAERALADAKVVATKAKDELPKTTEKARQRVLRQAMLDVQALQAFFELRQGRPENVLAMLNEEYWKNPPGDEDKAVQMLGYLCQAVRQWYEPSLKDAAKVGVPATLTDAWPRIIFAYETWRKMKERFPSSEEKVQRAGQSLNWLFNAIRTQADALRQQPNAPAELGDIAAAANRAFADLTEPTLSARSNPPLLFAVASVLWELEEQQRAVRLFELYMARIGDDPAVAALRDNPRDALATLDALISPRPELRKAWGEVRDLLIDDPELAKRIIEQDLPSERWGEKKRDYLLAVQASRTLREEATKNRMAIGPSYQAIDEGLKQLEAQCTQLGRVISVKSRLAAAYRGMGMKDKATELYQQLIAYDPTQPDYMAATVELTIDKLRSGVVPTNEVLTSERVKAARVRDAAPPTSPTYWTAVIQVLELSIALKDMQLVNNRLRFDGVNQSTPADDLQMRPRERRDDQRVRRARNPMSVDLCQRYLALFGQSGVTVKPSFRIDQADIDGQPTTIFVMPADGPKFASVRRELDDGSVVHFLWEEGKEPPPEPEAIPAPAPAPPAEAPPTAPEAAPAQPAPQPTPEAKP
jgi:hypothetical protein